MLANVRRIGTIGIGIEVVVVVFKGVCSRMTVEILFLIIIILVAPVANKTKILLVAAGLRAGPTQI